MWIRRAESITKSLTADLSPDQIELKGFNRSLAEIEWLLLVLVLAYMVIPGAAVERFPVIVASVAFASFVLAFRYLNLFTIEARWKLAIETWVMIGLTAFVIWHTGKSGSPLLNLYLLPIIFSAMTLGKLMTLLQVLLIASLYLHSAGEALGTDLFSYRTFSTTLFNFAPFFLVAYFTSLLAADMNFARVFAERLSETDELTGLPNMRAFGVGLRRERARADRDGRPFSVMMIDADNLKQINDNLGHEVGNQLIVQMVEAIRRTLRSSDFMARYGGDEFVMLLPATDSKRTGEAAERIRTAIANTTFDAGGERVASTVSIGHATYPDVAVDVDELMMRADQAMYLSKKAGRNTVTAYRKEAD